MFTNTRIRILLLCFAVVCTAAPACQTGTKEPASVKNHESVGGSENLLEAESAWALADDKAEMDPVQAHLLARSEVDPKHVSKKNKYTQNANDTHARDDANFRVLRLEAQSEKGQNAGLNEIQTAAATPPPAPAKKPVVKKAKRKIVPKAVRINSQQAANIQPAAGTPSGIISALRTGEHPGKTRIVLDADIKTAFDARLENAGKMVVISIPNRNWRASSQRSFGGHPLLRSYEAKSDGKGGTLLMIGLKAPGRLAYKDNLPPNAIYNNHRLVLDVAGR